MGIDPRHPAILAAARKGLIPAPLVGAGGGGPRQPPPPAPRRLTVEVTAAVRTVSEANAGGRNRARFGRKTAVKAAVAAALPRLAEAFPLPAVVTITRRSPGRLDDDNLRAALKAVRDEICSCFLGCDDADPRVTFRYRQRPGYGASLTIRVEHGGV